MSLKLAKIKKTDANLKKIHVRFKEGYRKILFFAGGNMNRKELPTFYKFGVTDIVVAESPVVNIDLTTTPGMLRTR